MNTLLRSSIYLLIFALVAVGGGAFIANAINRPTDGDSVTYRAEFSNVSGLRVGNDVRSLGVRVGKVTAVDPIRRDGTSLAAVTFSVTTDQHLYGDSKIAIRYLNLTGIRYLDLQQKASTGRPLAAGSTFGVASTIPSFDITEIFHGLAPIFAVMSPDDINHFSQSMLALVEGDGSGFGRVLNSLNKVLSVVDDRSAVVNVLVNNLQRLSTSLTGRSGVVTPIVGYLSDLATVLAERLPELRHIADFSGATLISVDRFLGSLGFRDNRTPDLDAIIGQIMPFARTAVGILALTPGILSALNGILPTAGTQPSSFTCSRGRATIPPKVAIFVRETQVTLCKR
ncbi:Mce family protein [Gordonia effusa NBRC 100432]|uniref:Mce family protein n=1 Tax=Gordonia effusa NBRC 100432 TaxID=1077974 RepID=H0R5M3_9ACTN|nr:MlaD family protein [Gordonia effusa]GAB20374.1 Mce family protein [Gordonia effusa NBRC 100432]